MTSSKDSGKERGPASTATSKPSGRTIDLKAEEVSKGEKAGMKAEATNSDGSPDRTKSGAERQSGSAGAKEKPDGQASAGPARRGSGFSFGAARVRVWSLAAMAAVVGAVAALAANALLYRSALSDGAGQIAELQTGLRGLTDRVESSMRESAQARDQLQQRLTELGGALETLGARLNTVEGMTDTAPREALADAQTRLTEIEKALSTLGATRENGTTIDFGAMTAELAELNQRLDALETGNGAALMQSPAETARIDALDRATNANQEVLAALQQRVAALQEAQENQSQRLQTVVQKETEQVETGERLARSMAAEALRTTYQRGAAFSGLLDTAAQLAATGPAPEALRQFAGSGAPTNAMLMEQFDAISGSIIEADRPPTESVTDWLVQGARSLVTIRPAGPVEGESADAIVSRIDDNIENGRLQAALMEWQRLSAPARSASQQWAEALDARIKADAAMAQLTAALEGNGSQ